MKLNRIKYSDLNAKQKENYNFHKVAAALAEYGYNSMRLNDDWQGADFIAVKDDSMLKIQLKGRFEVNKKYIGKDIIMAYIEDDEVKIFNHDEAVALLRDKTLNTMSWTDRGIYNWATTPDHFESIITVL